LSLSGRTAVIDIEAVTRESPHFETFCSVDRIAALVERLRRVPAFTVETLGLSAGGVPIHHVSFGTGATKVLWVGFPHCDEPIGGLTVFSLLTLLEAGQAELLGADVQWHVVPCIDPDGAQLNEGWSQQPYSLASYMRHFHKQQLRDQVDASFPIHHKGLRFDAPVPEARLLMGLLQRIRPDVYFPLHNAWAGGAFFFLTHDIEHRFHLQLYELLQRHAVPLQQHAPHGAWCAQFGPGIYEMFTLAGYYDTLSRVMAAPEEALDSGASSWEYLAQLNPSAQTFVVELPYVKHPSDGSSQPLGQSLRELKLRVDADNKYLATVLLEEWQAVEVHLDHDSPRYRKVSQDMTAARERLHEGLPSWPQKTLDLLSNPAYGRSMTEGERFNVQIFDRFYVLCHSHELVRLLHLAPQTPIVSRALERLEARFDQALQRLSEEIDFEAFEVIPCDTLVRVQLGGCLIALNSVLAQRRNPARDQRAEQQL